MFIHITYWTLNKRGLNIGICEWNTCQSELRGVPYHHRKTSRYIISENISFLDVYIHTIVRRWNRYFQVLSFTILPLFYFVCYTDMFPYFGVKDTSCVIMCVNPSMHASIIIIIGVFFQYYLSKLDACDIQCLSWSLELYYFKIYILNLIRILIRICPLVDRIVFHNCLIFVVVRDLFTLLVFLSV